MLFVEEPHNCMFPPSIRNRKGFDVFENLQKTLGGGFIRSALVRVRNRPSAFFQTRTDISLDQPIRQNGDQIHKAKHLNSFLHCRWPCAGKSWRNLIGVSPIRLKHASRPGASLAGGMATGRLKRRQRFSEVWN